MQKSFKPLNENALEMVAERFRILGDPVRLRLLQLLADGERSVSDLVQASGSAQANVSKHLQHLLRAGVVSRRKEGLRVFYRLHDPRVLQLCEVVCGSLGDQLERELETFRGGGKPEPGAEDLGREPR